MWVLFILKKQHFEQKAKKKHAFVKDRIEKDKQNIDVVDRFH